jgi:hypothetical protein
MRTHLSHWIFLSLHPVDTHADRHQFHATKIEKTDGTGKRERMGRTSTALRLSTALLLGSLVIAHSIPFAIGPR